MREIALAFCAAFVLSGCGRESSETEKAAPAEHRPRDVAQEAQRIQVGMTKAQVVEILGEPRTRVAEPAGERLTFWTFDDSQRVRARVYVRLDGEGKVLEVETIPL